MKGRWKRRTGGAVKRQVKLACPAVTGGKWNEFSHALILGSAAPERLVCGAVQGKKCYHEHIRRGGDLPCTKGWAAAQQPHRQEKGLLLETASGHSKGRNIATDIALSPGTAELHVKNINKMQPVVHPPRGPLYRSVLLFSRQTVLPVLTAQFYQKYHPLHVLCLGLMLFAFFHAEETVGWFCVTVFLLCS